MSDSDTKPYAIPSVTDIATKATDPPSLQRSLPREIVGTVFSMVAGAFLGLMVGGNGLGFISFVVLCALMGWIAWNRRRKSILGTVGIYILMIIVWWPFGIMLRELGRGLY